MQRHYSREHSDEKAPSVLCECRRLQGHNCKPKYQTAYADRKKNWEISGLSRDHKPDIPAEKERILKQGGRIEPFKDEHGNPLGPMRVWLPKQSRQTYIQIFKGLPCQGQSGTTCQRV